MPVAKKTTTNNKTNNKKQKSSLIQRLKLNTLKGRMLATVLVFAIVGGGVMVYRSFAATQYTFYPSSFKLDGPACSGYVSTDTKKDAAGNKNTVSAYWLNAWVGACGDGRYVFPQIYVEFGRGVTAGSDRAAFCAEVKAVNGATIWISSPTTASGGTDINLAPSLNTQTVCANERSTSYIGKMVLHNKSKESNKTIYVHKMYVDIGPYGPAPAPAK